jgi:hypothetical protein
MSDLWKKATKNTSSTISSSSSIVAQEATIIGESLSLLENVRLQQVLMNMETMKEKLSTIEKSVDTLYTILKNQRVKTKDDNDDVETMEEQSMIEQQNNDDEEVATLKKLISSASVVQTKKKKKGQKSSSTKKSSGGIGKSSSSTSTATKKRKVFEKTKFQSLKNNLNDCIELVETTATTTNTILNEKYSLSEESQRKYYMEPRFSSAGIGAVPKKFSLNFQPKLASVFYTDQEAIHNS